MVVRRGRKNKNKKCRKAAFLARFSPVFGSGLGLGLGLGVELGLRPYLDPTRKFFLAHKCEHPGAPKIPREQIVRRAPTGIRAQKKHPWVLRQEYWTLQGHDGCYRHMCGACVRRVCCYNRVGD